MKEELERLEKLRKLKENWDSYGGSPPTKEAAERAIQFIKGTFIAPLPDGGIQITFGEDEDVFIDIHPDGTWMVESFDKE